VQRVHPDRVTCRLDACAAAGGLNDPKLRLELRSVTAEGFEGFANPFRVESVPGLGDVLERR
jgi:hypothetical protein